MRPAFVLHRSTFGIRSTVLSVLVAWFQQEVKWLPLHLLFPHSFRWRLKKSDLNSASQPSPITLSPDCLNPNVLFPVLSSLFTALFFRPSFSFQFVFFSNNETCPRRGYPITNANYLFPIHPSSFIISHLRFVSLFVS